MTRAAITPLVYNQLVRLNAQLEIEPELAERWESAPDGSSITFWLRQGVRWHPPVNAELTADDVRFSLMRAKQELSDGRDYQVISKVEALDRYQVRVLLSQPSAGLLVALADPRFGAIVNREVANRTDNLREVHVGTGPFIVDGWDIGRELRFRRNREYFDGAPSLDRVTLRTVDDQRLERDINAGLGHLAVLAPGSSPASFSQASSVRTAPGPDLLTFLAINPRAAPFDGGSRTSDAVRMTVDPRALGRTVAGSAFVGPCPSILEKWRLDGSALDALVQPRPAEARRILGVRAGRPPAKLMVPGQQPWLLKVADMLKGQLAAVGFPLDVEVVDPAVWVRRWSANDYQLALAWSRGHADPDAYFRRAVHKDGQLWANWSDPQLDGLLDGARSEPDVARRKARYDEIQRVILERAPIAWLCAIPATCAQSVSLGGFKAHPLGHLGPLVSAWVA